MSVFTLLPSSRPADAATARLVGGVVGPRLPRPAPAVPAHLLARLARDHRGAGLGGRLALGAAAIEAHLPGGGLPLGQLHEIAADGLAAETGAPAAGFIACLLGRLARTRPVFWIAPRADLYPPGLPACGLDPGRLLLVQTADDADTLAAMETALREGAAAAVVGEVGRLDRTASRRLQFACLRHATTGFVLRRWPHGRGAAADRETSVAVTRWRLAAAPSAIEGREPGPPRWRAELQHVRGGRPGAWLIEMEEPDAPHPLRLVAVLADHPAVAQRRRAG